jgi:16S rRNA (cytidine1402-2'-O)-methyltransferase
MNNFLPGLYIVSTPIGNLEDITLRALNVLKNSDQILCEDTRRSLKLLNYYNIKKKLISNHKFNEKKILDPIIKLIKNGKMISIISDAGTPALSDPGLILIRECIKEKIKIFPIPGVSAITTAMSVSGYDEKYFFYGFLPKKEKEIESKIKELKDFDFNIVFFIPAVRINFYLNCFKKVFFGRKIFIGREMTKIHETFYRENLDDFRGFKGSLKGELTVVLSGKKTKNSKENILNKEKLKSEITKYLKRYTLKDVVKLISEKNNLPKKQVYSLCLSIKK